MHDLSWSGIGLGRVHSHHDRVPGLPARHDGITHASQRHSVEQSFHQRIGRAAYEHRSDRALVRVSSVSGLSHDGRHRAHALPATGFAQEAARMGFCRRSGTLGALRSGVVYLVDVPG